MYQTDVHICHLMITSRCKDILQLLCYCYKKIWNLNTNFVKYYNYSSLKIFPGRRMATPTCATHTHTHKKKC